VAWNTAASSKTSASITVATNDVVAFIGASEGPDTIGVPTTTISGLSFASQKNNTTSQTCGTRLAAGVATAAASGTISATNSSSTNHWGFGVWVCTGSQGIGNSSEQHTSTKTVAMTPASGAHASVVWGVFDYAAAAVTGISATPTPTHERQKVADATHYSYYVEDLSDQSSSGAVSYGISGGSGSGPFSIVVLEIKTGAGGGGGVRKRVTVTRK
jgi:hypothetical protein